VHPGPRRGQSDRFRRIAGQLRAERHALSPVIGYDKAFAIAHKANDEGTTLREAALSTGYVSADQFDRIVKPADMVGQPS